MINSNNFIIIYNKDNPESEEFAEYYALKHNMLTVSENTSLNNGLTGDDISWEVNGQMVGIGCSNTEILLSESDFNKYLLTPLCDAISTSDQLQNITIWGIIIGYNVPGGFYSGENIISSQSRLSRVNHSFLSKTKNKLYNRSIFKRYDSDDSQISLICSRIDAPNLVIAKEIIDNAKIVIDRTFVNGKMYIDPYSDQQGDDAETYTEMLINFKDEFAPNLNIEIFSTNYLGSYIDPSIPYVLNDSFIWSWFSDRGSDSFFQYSNTPRIFFYNADFDGAESVRDIQSKRWVTLSLKGGYSSCAGSLSNPGIDGFLNPSSFFNSLNRGSTVGEAFLFSCPYLDWTIGLFGDPLVVCSFPSSVVEDEDIIDEHFAWEEMSISLAKSVSHLYEKSQELSEVRKKILDLISENRIVEVDLLYPSNDLFESVNDISMRSQFQKITDSLFDFPRKRYYFKSSNSLAPNINTYLEDHSFKVSSLLSSISNSSIISSENIFNEGWWRFEFEMQDDISDYINYNFILYVFENEEDIDSLSQAVVFSNSNEGVGWKYEIFKDNFITIPFNGISSSYVGRKIRYESVFDELLGVNEYLERGKTYYFVVKQINTLNSEETSNRIFQQIIYT